MIFRRFYDDALAQASYLIGCERTRQAVVIDPNLAIDTYREAAAQEGVRITHVTETHIHADFASGARALAANTGAELHVSDEGGDAWRYSFLTEPGVHAVHDGDRLSVGSVHLDALHTPGHTPEHLAFLVIDETRSPLPLGAVTGDFLFVGDVGRPELLERAAGEAGTMHAAAADLYRSVQRFKMLPDYLQIWPGHGAGSACGRAMSSAARSTLGYERIANWALQPVSESDLVEYVLKDQPAAPPYFGAMKLRNRGGRIGNAGSLPRNVSCAEFASAPDDNVVLIDVRNPDEWARGHIGGAILIPLPELRNRLNEIPREHTIIVQCHLGARSTVAAATLDAFGFDDVHNLIGGIAAWEAEGHPVVC
ncbi:MAG: MBL fold metallo-hydrolase [Gemmatimonadaceae bacterium]